MNYKKIIFIIGLFILPSIAFAAPSNIQDLIAIFTDIIKLLIPLVSALAVLAFFWGLAKFILKAGDESGREEGRKLMFWGIVALFVLVSIWGILTLIYGEFELSGGIEFPPKLPTF